MNIKIFCKICHKEIKIVDDYTNKNDYRSIIIEPVCSCEFDRREKEYNKGYAEGYDEAKTIGYEDCLRDNI